jgi:formylglycine-generating enzyme required for sulfatase activity
LTLGRDEEVHSILQSITLEKRRQQDDAQTQKDVADLRNQITAAHQQIELLRSTLQTTTEDHRSALAQAKLAAAAELQKHAEELEGLLAKEQRQKDLLVAELQEKVKLIAQTNQLLKAQIAQNKEQNKNTGHKVNSETKQIKYATVELPQSVTLEMVNIPGGLFLMGSPEGQGEDNEKPQHQVTVPEFWMSKYPVTQAQWRSIAFLPLVKQELKPDPSMFQGDLRPVERVSWWEAIEFCARLSQLTDQQYRLPSEAEWEYACHANTTTDFYFGAALTKNLANHNSAEGETTDVGSYEPNAFGLYDMHGNIWEWCQDDWHDSYVGAPLDGSAWTDRNDNDYQKEKLLRGGSWFSNPNNCRSAYRVRINADNRSSSGGFRVVYSPART